MASGRCLCGQVSFDIERGVENCLVSYNHARGYREWTGASFFDAMLAPASVVTFHDAHGMLRTYEAGPTVRQFCGACGTPLSCKNAAGSTIELNRGVMHETSGKIVEPMYHIQCAEAVPRVINAMQDGLPRYLGLPDGSSGSSSQAPGAERSRTMPSKSTSSSVSGLSGSSASVSIPEYSQHAQPSQGDPSQPRQLLRLHASHIVDENSVANKAHSIISVPCDNVVELVNGDLEFGLGGEYADFIEVLHQGRVGKISRKVVSQVATTPQPPQPPPLPPQTTAQGWGGPGLGNASSDASNGSRQGLEGSMGAMNIAAAREPPQAVAPGTGHAAPFQAPQPTPPGDNADFIPAGEFHGSRHGYVYKNAAQGVGYYRDRAPTPVPAAGPESGAAPPANAPPTRSAPPGIKGKRRS